MSTEADSRWLRTDDQRAVRSRTPAPGRWCTSARLASERVSTDVLSAS